MDDDDLVWEGIPADEIDRLADTTTTNSEGGGNGTTSSSRSIATAPRSQRSKRKNVGEVRSPSGKAVAQGARTGSAGPSSLLKTEIEWSGEVRKQEIEQLKEEIRSLKISNAALQNEVNDAKWATSRAVELSSSLAKLVDERDQLKLQVETLSTKVSEFTNLDQLQQYLISEWDLGVEVEKEQRRNSGGGQSSNASLRTLSFDSGGSSLSPEDEAERARIVQDLLRKRIMHLVKHGDKTFSAGGADQCLQCLVHLEEKQRAEMKLLERNEVLQFQLVHDSIQNAQRYLSDQVQEMESNRMWEEDMRSHHVELFQVKRELHDRRKLMKQVKLKEAELEHWRTKYKELKEAGRKHVQELHDLHQDELKATRKAYLRCNPNLVFTEWLCKVTERLHRHYMTQSLALASTQRELTVLKSELYSLRGTFVDSIQSTAREVDRALRRCLPIVWDPVQNARREYNYRKDVQEKKKLEEKSRTEKSPQKQVVEYDDEFSASPLPYRPVVVAATPSKSKERASSDVEREGEMSGTPEKFSIGGGTASTPPKQLKNQRRKATEEPEEDDFAGVDAVLLQEEDEELSPPPKTDFTSLLPNRTKDSETTTTTTAAHRMPPPPKSLFGSSRREGRLQFTEGQGVSSQGPHKPKNRSAAGSKPPMSPSTRGGFTEEVVSLLPSTKR